MVSSFTLTDIVGSLRMGRLHKELLLEGLPPHSERVEPRRLQE